MIPDRIGEVEAWRAWTVIEPESRYPRLRSATATSFGIDIVDAIWPTNRWLYAICGNGCVDDAIPGEQCSCGLYAAKSLDMLLTYGYAQFQPDGVTAIGKVGLAGRVIEGSQGWKAQKGRIIELYLPFSQERLGGKLARAYNVPVELVAWWATDKRLLNLDAVLNS